VTGVQTCALPILFIIFPSKIKSTTDGGFDLADDCVGRTPAWEPWQASRRVADFQPVNAHFIAQGLPNPLCQKSVGKTQPEEAAELAFFCSLHHPTNL
jgi:hypothetical protein